MQSDLRRSEETKRDFCRVASPVGGKKQACTSSGLFLCHKYQTIVANICHNTDHVSDFIIIATFNPPVDPDSQPCSDHNRLLHSVLIIIISFVKIITIIIVITSHKLWLTMAMEPLKHESLWEGCVSSKMDEVPYILQTAFDWLAVLKSGRSVLYTFQFVRTFLFIICSIFRPFLSFVQICRALSMLRQVIFGQQARFTNHKAQLPNQWIASSTNSFCLI